MLAVMSLEVIGVILAGYASGSKWALFGGMREAAQMVSYEIPMSICVVIPIITAGSLNLNEIGGMQSGHLGNWIIFHDPFSFLAFFVYFVCATASCKRAPFDLAEAESELVAGFLTEYSGFRWSFFFLAEYASMFAVSGIAALLFLGGWHTGIPGLDGSLGDLRETGGIPGYLINVLGFLVFLLSALQSQAMYGVLLASTIVSALVADFLLMPALVLTFKPFGPEGKGLGDEHLTADA